MISSNDWKYIIGLKEKKRYKYSTEEENISVRNLINNLIDKIPTWVFVVPGIAKWMYEDFVSLFEKGNPRKSIKTYKKYFTMKIAVKIYKDFSKYLGGIRKYGGVINSTKNKYTKPEELKNDVVEYTTKLIKETKVKLETENDVKEFTIINLFMIDLRKIIVDKMKDKMTQEDIDFLKVKDKDLINDEDKIFKKASVNLRKSYNVVRKEITKSMISFIIKQLNFLEFDKKEIEEFDEGRVLFRISNVKSKKTKQFYKSIFITHDSKRMDANPFILYLNIHLGKNENEKDDEDMDDEDFIDDLDMDF